MTFRIPKILYNFLQISKLPSLNLPLRKNFHLLSIKQYLITNLLILKPIRVEKSSVFSLLGPTDIDAAIKRSEEGVKASKFPELSALVTDDEKSLEYTVIQQEFENEFPARRARQATDVAAWEAAYQKPGVTGDTLGEIPNVENLNAEGESIEVGELGPPPEREILRTEFATDLDESQIRALEEIRARREKQGRK